MALVLALGALAATYYVGRPGRDVVGSEAASSLPALAAFESRVEESEGAFVLSANPDDRIRWTGSGFGDCGERVVESAFQRRLADPERGYTPQGCLWEYAVIGARCEQRCGDAGEEPGCAGCFCAIATLPADAGRFRAGDRLCVDHTGRRARSGGRPRGW